MQGPVIVKVETIEQIRLHVSASRYLFACANTIHGNGRSISVDRMLNERELPSVNFSARRTDRGSTCGLPSHSTVKCCIHFSDRNPRYSFAPIKIGIADLIIVLLPVSSLKLMVTSYGRVGLRRAYLNENLIEKYIRRRRRRRTKRS